MSRSNSESRHSQNDSSTTKFKVTIFGSNNAPLNKTITLDDGKLSKVANGQFTEGSVHVLDCDGLEGFRDILEDLEPNMAIALGKPCLDGKWLEIAEVVTKNQLGEITDPPTISRTKDYFRFKDGEPGLMLFDIDGTTDDAATVLNKLHKVDPNLAQAGCLVVPSSSSGLRDSSSGELLSNKHGFHIYYLANDPSDIPRYAKVFSQQSWIKGFGRIELSTAGSFLVRQLADSAIYSPERLIFEAKPTLGKGLIQDAPQIEIHEGGVLDTTQLADLHPVEYGKYETKVNQAKESRQTEASQIRNDWLDLKATEIAETTGCNQSLARLEAQKLLATDQLPDSYTLKFDDFGWLSVDEVLSNHAEYDGKALADPIEHDYSGGRNVAKFFWNDGNPRIHSYAHGGKVYSFQQFESHEKILERAIEESMENPGAIWKPTVMAAAGSIYGRNREAYESARAMLVKSCGAGQVTKWEKKLLSSSDKAHESRICELVNLVNLAGNTFHDEKKNGYITLKISDHKETWALDSEGFYEWLEYHAFKNLEDVPSEYTMKSTITVLQAQAKHDGGQHPVNVRCAPYKDGYLIDMTNDKWQVAYASSNGWEVLDESPVKFIRSQLATPYPMPTHGSSTRFDGFWDHVNIPEECRSLVTTFMIESLRPDTVFTILELTGEQGSAKSSTHTRIRDLTDPNAVPLRSAPKDVQDIFVAAGSNWQASFENMSMLSDAMQDGLCTLTTGGGFATRKLYSNREESVIDVKRPCIINGITAVATRTDLIDRIIHIDLPPIQDYVQQSVLEERWELARPDIFSGFLDLFCEVLKQLPNVTIKELPRMGDYALLGQAVHEVTGDTRAFIDVYNENRSASLFASLESSPATLELLEFAKEHPEGWTGTCKDLLETLRMGHHGGQGWPTSPKGLGGLIRRMGPALRAAGVEIETIRSRRGYELTVEYFPLTKSISEQVHNVHKYTEFLKYD